MAMKAQHWGLSLIRFCQREINPQQVKNALQQLPDLKPRRNDIIDLGFKKGVMTTKILPELTPEGEKSAIVIQHWGKDLKLALKRAAELINRPK